MRSRQPLSRSVQWHFQKPPPSRSTQRALELHVPLFLELHVPLFLGLHVPLFLRLHVPLFLGLHVLLFLGLRVLLFPGLHVPLCLGPHAHLSLAVHRARDMPPSPSSETPSPRLPIRGRAAYPRPSVGSWPGRRRAYRRPRRARLAVPRLLPWRRARRRRPGRA